MTAVWPAPGISTAMIRGPDGAAVRGVSAAEAFPVQFAKSRFASAKPSSGESAPTMIRVAVCGIHPRRSEEHTSELQSLMRISYAVFCLKKKKKINKKQYYLHHTQYHN